MNAFFLSPAEEYRPVKRRAPAAVSAFPSASVSVRVCRCLIQSSFASTANIASVDTEVQWE